MKFIVRIASGIVRRGSHERVRHVLNKWTHVLMRATDVSGNYVQTRTLLKGPRICTCAVKSMDMTRSTTQQMDVLTKFGKNRLEIKKISTGGRDIDRVLAVETRTNAKGVQTSKQLVYTLFKAAGSICTHLWNIQQLVGMSLLIAKCSVEPFSCFFFRKAFIKKALSSSISDNRLSNINILLL